MDTCIEELGTRFGVVAVSEGPEEMILPTSREGWIEEYAGRILELYMRWQTPLGVAQAYTGKIKEDLAGFYDDPLKRMFIEATYSRST